MNTPAAKIHAKRLGAGKDPHWTPDWPHWYAKHGIDKAYIDAVMP